jgi:hypothetical protein
MKAMKVVFAFRNEVDQNKVGEKNTQNFTVNTTYTEPLGKKWLCNCLSN